MAASFVTSGILNRDLFYRANNQEILFVWAKIHKIVDEMRTANKNPIYWASLEEAAKGYIEYANENAPGWWEQFEGNIARSGQPAPPR